MLLIIPAIDLREGRCVRLRHGHVEAETDYFEEPAKMAKLWRVQNARTLHIADLDARTADAAELAKNRAVVRQICEAVDIPVQLSGGIATLEDVETILSLGIYRVVLSTAALVDPDLVGEAVRKHTNCRIAAGIRAREGVVEVDGVRYSAVDLALEAERQGVRRIVYTEVSREGTLGGANIGAFREMGKALGKRTRLTAAGGVSGYEDLLRLKELGAYGLDSAIVGRALYENRFPCQRFWSWHQKDEVDLDRFSTARLRGEPC